ncbi:8185_t:CDS:2, partial [Ambispora leptoticha]
KPIKTKEIAKLFQNSKKQALGREIKKIEKEINQSLTDELKELVSDFIQARKQMVKNENYEEAKGKALELEDQLLDEKGLEEENIEKIIKEKIIRVRDENNFKGQLVIEEYSKLEKLYLRSIKSVDKIILKNLIQLQECTILDCDTKELIVENCSQIKKLNIENNILTNLGFIKDLESLEELKMNGNTELIEILAPYYGENEKNKWLEENQPLTIDNPIDFEKKYQKLKETLNSLLEKEQIKTEELIKLEKQTKEINLEEKEEQNDIVTSDLFKKLKEDKNNLSKLRKTNQELEKKLSFFEQTRRAKKQEIEQKEKELEELKTTVGDKLDDKEKEVLKKLLEIQDDFIKSNSSLVSEITQLNLETQKSLNQTSQFFNIKIKDSSGINFGNVYGSHASGVNVNNIGKENIAQMEGVATSLSQEEKELAEKPIKSEKGKKTEFPLIQEQQTEKTEENKQIFPYTIQNITLSSHTVALNSEHPAAKLYNNFYTLDLPALSRDYKNVIKFTKNLSLNNNPDDYLKPYDIVKVNRKGGTYQHAAIYLGNAKEIEIHHPFIPFKKPELIQKHIEIAIKAEYGICRQKNINTISKATKSSDYLLQAIQETNQFFEQLEKDQLQQEAWVEIPS